MLQRPEHRSNHEVLGSTHGFTVAYDRIDRTYELTGPCGDLTVRAQDLTDVIRARGEAARGSDRRHFTGDDEPIGPDDGDPDEDCPDADDPDADHDPDFDPDDVADLIEHDIRATAAWFGPAVRVHPF